MTARSTLDRLHGAAIRVQLPVVLVAIPIVVALHAVVVVPVAADVATSARAGSQSATATTAAAISAGLIVVLVAAATAFASMLLRGSIRATVEQLQEATDAVARGNFRHRVATGRTDELGALAASIDVMAERLERLEHARRRMLACVSHELRTPLTIIQGHAFTLARHEADVIRRDRLELVQGETRRLAALIDDLVEAASLHSGGVRLQVERRDVVQLVSDEVARFEEEAEARGIAIDIDPPRQPIMADIDAPRIAQVLSNLMTNAVRHADADTTVRVALGVAGQRCRVTIENRCEPIPATVADQLFEPFVQATARSGSVGLGLVIVQAIVAAHGGRAWVDVAAAQRGVARMSFELPATAPAPHALIARHVSSRLRPATPRLAVEQ